MNDRDSLEHAWRYFELHAGQRMAAFNFFIGITGLALAGMGACVANVELRWIGSALGLVVVLVAFVFFQLDVRTSFLIKHSEEAIIALEESLPTHGRIFTSEPQKSATAKVATYGWCFRVTFATVALLGLMGSTYCFFAWRV